MQNVWESYTGHDGTLRWRIVADTTVDAFTISDCPDWLYSTDRSDLVSAINQANAWLNQNKGAL